MMLVSRLSLLTSALALCGGVAAFPQGHNALVEARNPSSTAVAAFPTKSPSTPVHAASGAACNNSPDLCSRAYNNVTYL